MSEPVRKDEPLSDLRFPESPGSTASNRPGPVPVARRTETLNGQPLLPENATDKPLGEWPELHDHQAPASDMLRADLDNGRLPDRRLLDPLQHNDRYSSTAETVGNVIGVVVDRAKQIPGFMADRAQDLRRKFKVIRGRAERSELPDQVKARAAEYADEAQRQVRIYRNRAERLAHDYPLEFIGGAAATGFVVGFLLRMWRDE